MENHNQLQMNIIEFKHDSFSDNVYPSKIIHQDSRHICQSIYSGISHKQYPYGYIYYIVLLIDDRPIELRFISKILLSKAECLKEVKTIIDTHQFTFIQHLKLTSIRTYIDGVIKILECASLFK